MAQRHRLQLSSAAIALAFARVHVGVTSDIRHLRFNTVVKSPHRTRDP
jgi:hypothetical protein